MLRVCLPNPQPAARRVAQDGPMNTLPPFPALDWVPALQRPDLLAPVTAAALAAWAGQDPRVASQVMLAPIDPALADTTALTAAYDLPLAASANCVVVLGRRAGSERTAAAVVLATTRADVNSRIRHHLDVRKASFLAMERAVAETGMEYGGITPVGLPAAWPVLVDTRVAEADHVIIGSGVRGSKLALPGALMAQMPGAHVIKDLALG